MDNVKAQAARLVERLTDTATWDDLMYQIYVRQKNVVPDERHARLRGQEESASSDEVPDRSSTFSQRWRGKFVSANRDDERYQALAKRYL